MEQRYKRQRRPYRRFGAVRLKLVPPTKRRGVLLEIEMLYGSRYERMTAAQALRLSRWLAHWFTESVTLAP